MSDLSLQANQRFELGSGSSQRLRKQGKVPAVIYGSKKDPLHVTFCHRELDKWLNKGNCRKVIDLTIVGGKDAFSEKVILKDIQRHPYKLLIMHVDFLRVDLSQKITVSVPIHFINEEHSPAVKQHRGVVTHLVSQLEVHVLPDKAPEAIEIDLSSMELDQTLHVSEISIPSGVELTALSHRDAQDLALVTVHKPSEERERGIEDLSEKAQEEGNE